MDLYNYVTGDRRPDRVGRAVRPGVRVLRQHPRRVAERLLGGRSTRWRGRSRSPTERSIGYSTTLHIHSVQFAFSASRDLRVRADGALSASQRARAGYVIVEVGFTGDRWMLVDRRCARRADDSPEDRPREPALALAAPRRSPSRPSRHALTPSPSAELDARLHRPRRGRHHRRYASTSRPSAGRQPVSRRRRARSTSTGASRRPTAVGMTASWLRVSGAWPRPVVASPTGPAPTGPRPWRPCSAASSTPHGKPIGPWVQIDNGGCPEDPPADVIVTATDFAALPLQPSPAHLQPGDGRAIVGMDLIMYTDPTPAGPGHHHPRRPGHHHRHPHHLHLGPRRRPTTPGHHRPRQGLPPPDRRPTLHPPRRLHRHPHHHLDRHLPHQRHRPRTPHRRHRHHDLRTLPDQRRRSPHPPGHQPLTGGRGRRPRAPIHRRAGRRYVSTCQWSRIEARRHRAVRRRGATPPRPAARSPPSSPCPPTTCAARRPPTPPPSPRTPRARRRCRRPRGRGPRPRRTPARRPAGCLGSDEPGSRNATSTRTRSSSTPGARTLSATPAAPSSSVRSIRSSRTSDPLRFARPAHRRPPTADPTNPRSATSIAAMSASASGPARVAASPAGPHTTAAPPDLIVGRRRSRPASGARPQAAPPRTPWLRRAPWP